MPRTKLDADRKKIPCTAEGCDKEYVTYAGLDAHIAAKHSGPHPLHACTQEGCSFVGVCKSTLEIHMNTVHLKSRNFKCYICDKSYVTMAVLIKHKTDVHATESTSSRDYRESCPEPGCGRDYAHKSALQEHIRTAHQGERVECPKCDKVFAHLSSMKTHLRKHESGATYPCDGCDKEFESKGGLREHRKAEHGPEAGKLLVCPRPGCGVTFTRKGNLTTHLKEHSPDDQLDPARGRHCKLPNANKNVPKRKCDHCAKEYITLRALHNHISKVHNLGAQQHNIKLLQKIQKRLSGGSR